MAGVLRLGPSVTRSTGPASWIERWHGTRRCTRCGDEWAAGNGTEHVRGGTEQARADVELLHSLCEPPGRD